jgi:peptidoglycan/LPS O-acetylase OafA/YrhL
MDQTAAKSRILSFDGLRGLAAIAVVCLHLTRGMAPLHGFLAVDLFFLLSGFVIAGAYEARLASGAGALWFFRTRMARLYPLYAFGLLLGALSLLSEPATLVRGAACNLLFLPDPLPADRSLFPLDGPAWSLSAEVAVNLLYGWGGHRLNNRTLLGLIALAAAGVAAAAFTAGTADLGWRATWIDLAGAVARVMFGFPLGVLMYRLHKAGRLPRISCSPLLPLALTTAVLLIGMAHVALLDVSLILAVVPALFLLHLGARAPEGLIASACHWLGRLSYPIYVVHGPLISLFSPGSSPMSDAARLMQIPRLAPAILLFALGACLWVEPQGRRWMTLLLAPSVGRSVPQTQR